MKKKYLIEKIKNRWHIFWHTPIKTHLHNLYLAVKPYLSWKIAPCFIIAWCLIDGWTYAFIYFGARYSINWMEYIGLSAEAILWFPLTIEKPIVIAIGIFIYKVLFKKKLDKNKFLK